MKKSLLFLLFLLAGTVVMAQVQTAGITQYAQQPFTPNNPATGSSYLFVENNVLSCLNPDGSSCSIPVPGSTGLCLVSTGSTAGAYTFGSCSGATSTNFSALVADAPNTSAGTFQIGNGTTLATTGTGIINANRLGGATFAAPGAIGGTTPAAGTFTTLVGTAFTASTSITDSALGLGVVHSSAGGLFSSSSVANADLANSATTVNGQTCTLGSTCTVPFQTNTVNNTSQAGINNLTSTANSVGLTVTPTNSGTNQVKYEITGASYTGNAATATTAGNVTGTVAIANGGSGQTTAGAAFNAFAPAVAAAGGLIVSSAANTYGSLPIGTANQCLTVNGGATALVWSSCASGSIGGSGTINNIAKFTGSTTTIGDSALTDTGTVLTYTGTGGLTLSGSGTSLKALEGAAPTGSAGSDWLYADSTAHRWKVKNNSNTADTPALFSDNLSVFAATTSAQLAGVISDETGSGALVFGTSPTLTTPNIGVATATSVNGLTITASTGTLTITNAKTVSFPHTITLTSSGDSSVITFPNATANALTDNAAVTVAQGGTGAGTFTIHGLLTGQTTGAFHAMAAGTANQFVQSGGASADPVWSAYTLPATVAANQALYATGTTAVTAGTLPIAAGGTANTTAPAAFNALSPLTTAGDTLYGGTAGAGTRLAAGTATQVLHSGTTPAWGAVVLTTDVSGALPIANGGTANTTAAAGFDALAPTTTQGDLILRGASSNARLAVGTNGQCLTSNGTTAVWGSCSTGSITGSGLVATQVAVASSSSAITSYSGFTSDGSGNVTMASATIVSAVAGQVALGQGTAAGAPTNAVGLSGPTTVPTGYSLVYPSAATTGYFKASTSTNQTGCTASATNMCGQFESTIGLAAASGDVSGVLPPANGGSGIASPTAHTILLGESASAFGTVSVGATGTVLIGSTGADPSFSNSLLLGSTTAGIGSVALAGNTSGVVTILPQAAAGTYNFNLPTSAGSSGQPLLSGGGGAGAQTYGTLGIAAGGTNATSAAAGTVPNATSSSAASWTATPTLGVQNTTQGNLILAGSASGPGIVTFAPSGVSATNATTLQGGIAASPVTITLPVTTTTLAGLAQAETFTALQTFGTNISIGGVTAGGATGTGNVVFATTPTLTTPVLGVATATSINKLTFTQPATGSTLTIIDGKTLTATNTMDVAKTAGVAGGIWWADTTTSQSSTGAGTAKQLVLSGGATTPTFADFPDVKVYPAANCVSTVAGAAWDTALTPTCVGGSNNLGGYLPFVDTSVAQFNTEIPADWDTASQAFVNLFFTSGANTTGTAIFNVAVACTKADGSITSDPAFNTADSFTTKTMAAASRAWSTTIQLTQQTSGNNCVPGGTMIVKITRATDTASTALFVTKAAITTPRLLTVQAN